MNENPVPFAEPVNTQTVESTGPAGANPTLEQDQLGSVVEDSSAPEESGGTEADQQPQWAQPYGVFRPPPPVPPADMQEAARHAPDHWIGMIDPAWKEDGVPPEWATVGWWRSGSTGKIEGWRENKEYRPSPQAIGWPEPTDPVDAAVQLASTGYGTVEDVTRSLAAAEVGFLVHSDGTPVCGAAPDHTPVLPIYTAPTHIEAVGRLLFEVGTVAEVVDQLPLGHKLYVNPSGPVSMVVEIEPLLSELESHDDVDAEADESLAEFTTVSVAETSGVEDGQQEADGVLVAPTDELESEARQ
ncbi:type VII secretion system-associated protein [Streptomyces sp. NPDC020681]|uniref:type VII secretion system-associated protein n=1 Tax=Streptomyces sp. NPDC020681 TaxID=3365083 RepID=UPI00378E16BC